MAPSRPHLSLNVRRLGALCFFYFGGAVSLIFWDYVLIVPLSRFLYDLGLRATYISEVSLGTDPGTTLGATLAVGLITSLIFIPVHLALVAVALLATTRLRRGFIRHLFRISAASCGVWILLITPLLVTIGHVSGIVAAIVVWALAVLLAAVVGIRRCYWSRVGRILPICRRCGYSLQGQPTAGRCPECGAAHGSPAHTGLRRN